MQARGVLLIIGLGMLGSPGCKLGTTAHDVSARVHQSVEDRAEQRRNAQWASQAWNAECQAHPGWTWSEDHACGFRDGFEEYLWHGGNGEPPPLPPVKYRAVQYQTPQGYQAIEEWFAGYRHGAAVAHQGGYRNLVTGPSSLHGQQPGPNAAIREGQAPVQSLTGRMDSQPIFPSPEPLPGWTAGPSVPPSLQPELDLARRWNWIRPSEEPPPLHAPDPPVKSEEPIRTVPGATGYAEGRTVPLDVEGPDLEGDRVQQPVLLDATPAEPAKEEEVVSPEPDQPAPLHLVPRPPVRLVPPTSSPEEPPLEELPPPAPIFSIEGGKQP
jgi:hypothetical protein